MTDSIQSSTSSESARLSEEEYSTELAEELKETSAGVGNGKVLTTESSGSSLLGTGLKATAPKLEAENKDLVSEARQTYDSGTYTSTLQDVTDRAKELYGQGCLQDTGFDVGEDATDDSSTSSTSFMAMMLSMIQDEFSGEETETMDSIDQNLSASQDEATDIEDEGEEDADKISKEATQQIVESAAGLAGAAAGAYAGGAQGASTGEAVASDVAKIVTASTLMQEESDDTDASSQYEAASKIAEALASTYSTNETDLGNVTNDIMTIIQELGQLKSSAGSAFENA